MLTAVCCVVRRDVPDYTGARVQDGSRPNKGSKDFNLYTNTYFGGDKDAALAAVKAQDGAAKCAPLSPACLFVSLPVYPVFRGVSVC